MVSPDCLIGESEGFRNDGGSAATGDVDPPPQIARRHIRGHSTSSEDRMETPCRHPNLANLHTISPEFRNVVHCLHCIPKIPTTPLLRGYFPIVLYRKARLHGVFGWGALRCLRDGAHGTCLDDENVVL